MQRIERFRQLLRVAESIKPEEFGVGWDKCLSAHMLRDPWFRGFGIKEQMDYTPEFAGKTEFEALLKFFGYDPDIYKDYEKWFDHPIRRIFGFNGTLAERIEVVRTILEGQDVQLETGSEVRVEILLVYNQVPENLKMYRVPGLVEEDKERLRRLHGKVVNSTDRDCSPEDYEFVERVIREFGVLIFDDWADDQLPVATGSFDVIVFTFLL